MCFSLDNSNLFCTGRPRSKKSGKRFSGGGRNIYLNEEDIGMGGTGSCARNESGILPVVSLPD